MVAELPVVLTVKQVAKHLEVSPDTVRRMAREKEIESFMVRGARRFTVDAVAEYIRRGKA